MEIEEVLQDVKKATGDKGFFILGAVVVGIFIYNLTKKDTSATDSELVPATGYVGYPSVENNANVILDSMEKSIDYAQGEIQGSIKDSQEEMKSYLNENFSATNDYINKGLEKQKDLLNINHSQLTGQLNDMNTKIDTINQTTSQIDQTTSQINQTTSQINQNTKPKPLKKVAEQKTKNKVKNINTKVPNLSGVINFNLKKPDKMKA